MHRYTDGHIDPLQCNTINIKQETYGSVCMRPLTVRGSLT